MSASNTVLIRPEEREYAAEIERDKELVLDFVSGNRRAFDELYAFYSRFVYNTCLRIIGSPDDARDALQETFIAVCRFLPRFKVGNRFSTWVYRIAVNKSIDMVRRRKKLVTGSLDWLEDVPMPEHDLVREIAVRQAILKLKPDYRAVMVLFYFQGLSYNDIAEIMQCSMDEIRSRLYRARQAFKAEYEGGESSVEM